MPQAPGRKRWVRRHPVLAGVWLVIATIWLLAAIGSYDDDLPITVAVYLVIMAPITLIILGLGRLSDLITTRHDRNASVTPIQTVASSVAPSSDDLALRRRVLDEEARRQRQMALDLKEREEALRHREELLLAQPLPPLPELKPERVQSVTPLNGSTSPARYCFGCGAWFGRPEDDTCRVCGAPRVGAEA